MNITVYCSSSSDLDEKYIELATRLGQWMGHHRHTLVHGGVNAGLMHITAAAVHDAGGKVIGVVPEVFAHRADPLNDELLLSTDLSDRKGRMMSLADAFVVLPGGLGTLDEWISTLSQLQVTPGDDRGIIVANLDNMYDGMLQQLHSTQHSAMGRGKRMDRCVVVSDAAQLIQALEQIEAKRNN